MSNKKIKKKTKTNKTKRKKIKRCDVKGCRKKVFVQVGSYYLCKDYATEILFKISEMTKKNIDEFKKEKGFKSLLITLLLLNINNFFF